MRIGPLIVALVAGVSGLAASTPAAALAPGPGALATTYQASAAASDKGAALVAVKLKGKERPPGWSRGRKTGWGWWGVPPGQLKKGRF